MTTCADLVKLWFKIDRIDFIATNLATGLVPAGNARRMRQGVLIMWVMLVLV